jgi:hypothetical protein
MVDVKVIYWTFYVAKNLTYTMVHPTKDSVGHLFSNAMNQEQGNTIVKCSGPSSSEALPHLG